MIGAYVHAPVATCAIPVAAEEFVPVPPLLAGRRPVTRLVVRSTPLAEPVPPLAIGSTPVTSAVARSIALTLHVPAVICATPVLADVSSPVPPWAGGRMPNTTDQIPVSHSDVSQIALVRFTPLLESVPPLSTGSTPVTSLESRSMGAYVHAPAVTCAIPVEAEEFVPVPPFAAGRRPVTSAVAKSIALTLHVPAVTCATPVLAEVSKPVPPFVAGSRPVTSVEARFTAA